MPPRGFLSLHGRATLVGKRPDGDSVRFDPDDPELLEQLERGEGVEPDEDGTFQLRLEGIDAPERSYNGEEQPLAEPARDELLERLGFRSVRFDDDGTVLSATPRTRRVAISSRAFDVTRRPISYLLADPAGAPENGADVPIPAAFLRATVNASLLASSLAYLTLYDTTPAAHRRTLRAIARRAREENRGVWRADSTASFSVESQASLGPRGDLVLPKLFRRATDYIADRDEGFEGTLVAWLRQAMADSGSEDDEVMVGGRRTRLSELLRQRGSRVRFDADADLLDLVFVAK